MKIIRVEHMSVMRGDYAAGPYADSSFTEAEHHDSDMYSWDNVDDCEYCIHTYSDRLCWETGNSRPTPYSDGIYSVGTNDFFGFRSMDYLSSWWSGEFKRLERFGFVLAVYGVEDNHARHGCSQSVFDMEKATMLKQFSISNRRGARRFMER